MCLLLIFIVTNNYLLRFIYIKHFKSVCLSVCLSFILFSDVHWRVQSLKMERKRRVKEDSWTSSNGPPNLTNQINLTNQKSQRKTRQLLYPLVHPRPLEFQCQLLPSLRNPPHQRLQWRAQHLSQSQGIDELFFCYRTTDYLLNTSAWIPVYLSFTNKFCVHFRDASSRSQPTDYSSSSDRSEELRTPDSIDEPWEGSDGRGSPQGGRRYPGVQMMGSGLLAEMKAKQERRAHKVIFTVPDKKGKGGKGGKQQHVAKVVLTHHIKIYILWGCN